MGYKFLKRFNAWPVYPGHPVTIALEIMLTYDGNIEAALERNKYGVADAVSNHEITGGGGSVHEGCKLLRFIRDKEKSPQEAIEWGFKRWSNRTLVGGDHRDKYEEGEAQAEELRGELLERLEKWLEE